MLPIYLLKPMIWKLVLQIGRITDRGMHEAKRSKYYTFIISSASRRAKTKVASVEQSRVNWVFISLVRVSQIISRIRCRWGPGVGSPLETR